MNRYIEEKAFLDRVANDYDNEISRVSTFVIDTYIKKYSKYINKGDGLELGCSYGYSTIMISNMLNSLDVIDGSEKIRLYIYELCIRACN